MNYCQDFLRFIGTANCFSKGRKKISEDGLVIVPETKLKNQEKSKNLENKDLTLITQNFISNDFTLTSYEEEIKLFDKAIKEQDSDVLAGKIEKSDLNTFVDSEGFSLLHKAVFTGNLKTVSIIAPKINLNATDDSGRTALHYACLQQNIHIADYLIEIGSDLEMTDNYGKLPVDYLEDPNLLRSFSESKQRSGNLVSSAGETGDDTMYLMLRNIKSHKKYFVKNYEIIRNIGTGSFSRVFLVRKGENGEYYAMKVMNKHKICEKGMLNYIITEKNLLSKLKHPFIVPLVSTFQTKRHLMLVLHYCSDNLYDKLKNKKFPIRIIKLYTAEIALAIGYLHSVNVIYRDLKPSNILINQDGHIMLADFGLAKESSNMTASSFCGSLGYLAPEMEVGQDYGKDVDWYMLGLVLFEMLTNSPFFDSPEKLEKIKGKKRLLLNALLEKDPRKRLGHSSDLAEIQSHPFFKDISWEKILSKPANLFEQFSLKAGDFNKIEKIMSLSFIND